MVIELDPELAAAITAYAAKSGIRPEDIAVDALRWKFMPNAPLIPRTDWERLVFSLGMDCGVVLPPEAMSSEGYYE